jgi:hypothetical protein
VQCEFVPPRHGVTGHFYVQVLQRLRAAVRTKRRYKFASRDSGLTHRVTHRLLCHHLNTVLSGSRSDWLLAVPYSENGPQKDTFRNRGGHKIERDGWTPEDSKRSLTPVLPTVAGWSKCVRACARILFWRWLSKCCRKTYYIAIPSFWELFDCHSYFILTF